MKPSFAFVCLLLTAGCSAPGPGGTSNPADSARRLSQAVPVADHHQHLFGPALRATLAEHGVGLPPIEASDLVAHLDSAGIRRALVLSAAYMYAKPGRPVEDEVAKVRAENDWTAAQVAAYPDRLRAFCAVNPLADYAVAEVERCARDPHLRRGLKLHFGNSDVQLDDPDHVGQLKRVFRVANENRMALAIHTRASVSMERPYGVGQGRIFLDELLPAAPDVPVQIAHLGGSGPGYGDPPAVAFLDVLAEAVERGDPRAGRLLFDAASIVTADAPPTDLARVAARVRQVGPDRVLFGSDAATGPGTTPRERWAAFRRLPLTDAEFVQIAENVAPYMR